MASRSPTVGVVVSRLQSRDCWCDPNVDLVLDPTIPFHIGYPCYGLHYKIGRIPHRPHCKTLGRFETCPSAHQTDPLHPLKDSQPWAIHTYHREFDLVREDNGIWDPYAEADLRTIGHSRRLLVPISPLESTNKRALWSSMVLSACLTPATLSSRFTRASQAHPQRSHLYDTSEGPVFVAWDWRVALCCKDIPIEPGVTKRCLPFPL